MGPKEHLTAAIQLAFACWVLAYGDGRENVSLNADD